MVYNYVIKNGATQVATGTSSSNEFSYNFPKNTSSSDIVYTVSVTLDDGRTATTSVTVPSGSECQGSSTIKLDQAPVCTQPDKTSNIWYWVVILSWDKNYWGEYNAKVIFKVNGAEIYVNDNIRGNAGGVALYPEVNGTVTSDKTVNYEIIIVMQKGSETITAATFTGTADNCLYEEPEEEWKSYFYCPIFDENISILEGDIRPANPTSGNTSDILSIDKDINTHYLFNGNGVLRRSTSEHVASCNDGQEYTYANIYFNEIILDLRAYGKGIVHFDNSSPTHFGPDNLFSYYRYDTGIGIIKTDDDSLLIRVTSNGLNIERNDRSLGSSTPFIVIWPIRDKIDSNVLRYINVSLMLK